MSIIRAIKHRLGLSVTPANNFVLDASADNGTMKLTRETGQDIILVDAAGKVTFPQGYDGTLRVGPFAGSLGVIDLDDIPAWVNRITLLLDKLSCSGSSQSVNVRLKVGGVAVTSGYDSIRMVLPNAAGNSVGTDTANLLVATTLAATDTVRGVITIQRLSENQWQGDMSVYRASATAAWVEGTGSIALAGPLTGVQILSSAGALDSGSLVAIYEA